MSVYLFIPVVWSITHSIVSAFFVSAISIKLMRVSSIWNHSIFHILPISYYILIYTQCIYINIFENLHIENSITNHTFLNSIFFLSIITNFLQVSNKKLTNLIKFTPIMFYCVAFIVAAHLRNSKFYDPTCLQVHR